MTDTSTRDADAIRYAVLRKLAPGFRHVLMGQLQALQFSAELATRMLDAGVLGPKLAECLSHMPEQARAAVRSCGSIIEWLRPEDSATTTVEEALRQCLRVAADDWSLRGIEASTDVRTGGALVFKTALREILVTSLLALTDAYPGPINIGITAEPSGGDVVVKLRAERTDRNSRFPPQTLYRAMTFDDVATIGREHGVACACADGVVTLRLPMLPAAA